MFSKFLFMGVAFGGSFIIIAALIASFQQVHATRDVQERTRVLRQRRQGIVAAFVMLDDQDRAVLTFEKYYRLIQALTGAKKLGELKDADRGGLRVSEFIDVLEKVLYAPVGTNGRFCRVYGEAGLLSRTSKQFTFQQFASSCTLLGQLTILPWLDGICIFMVCVQIVTLSLVGTFVGDDVLSFQRYVPVFLLWNVIELFLRISVLSWRGYWNDSSDAHSMARARFDFVIVGASCVLWVFSVLPYDAFGGGLESEQASWPALAAMVLPILRMFSSVKSSRELVFGMAQVLRSCPPIITVMVLVSFEYAMLGLLLFHGKFDALPAEIYSMQTNFNTLANACLAVLQLCYGEGWHDIMYAAIDAEHDLWPAMYFVSFTLFVMILLSNIVVGVIIDAFHKLHNRKPWRDGAQENRTLFEAALRKLCRSAMREQSNELAARAQAAYLAKPMEAPLQIKQRTPSLPSTVVVAREGPNARAELGAAPTPLAVTTQAVATPPQAVAPAITVMGVTTETSLVVDEKRVVTEI
eukprot:g4938.t1